MKSLDELIESMQDDPEEDAERYAARQSGCGWPGCRQRTHSYMANDWCAYGGGDPSDGLIEGQRARNQSVWRRNLSRRLKRPALGNGHVQKAARRALWALGTASTSQIIEFAYAGRLLMLGERRKNDLNRAARRALLAIGARRIGRASTRGRPWRWRLGRSH